MGLMTNFTSVLVALATSFTATYADMNVAPPPDKLYNFAQRNTEQASSIAQGSSMTAGVVVIDRAKGNAMSTNDTPSHQQFPLETLAKLPIIFYAVRVDPEVAKGKVSDAISMIQGYSAEATTAMWEKYGGVRILQDLSQRYNLQETTAKTEWFNSSMSAVDVGRLIRRFIDDKEVSAKEKRWVFRLMRTSPASISGEDLSWGIPTVAGLVNENNEIIKQDTDKTDKMPVTWMQGWSPTGKDPMVRHSVGLIGPGYRFITVTLGQFPSSTSNEDANRVSTQTVQELLKGGDGGSTGEGITLGSEDKTDDAAREKFVAKNKKYI